MFHCLRGGNPFCIVHTVDRYSFIYVWSQVDLKRTRFDVQKTTFEACGHVKQDEQNVLLMWRQFSHLLC